MSFPQISGSTLNGHTFTFPQNLEGELNILFIAFDISHQNDVHTWLPYTESLLPKYLNLHYYEVVVVGSQNDASQEQIDEEMEGVISAWSTRERTIKLYMLRQEFCYAVDLPDDRHIYTLLVNRVGRIMWAAEGPLISEFIAADLEIAIAALQPQR